MITPKLRDCPATTGGTLLGAIGYSLILGDSIKVLKGYYQTTTYYINLL